MVRSQLVSALVLSVLLAACAATPTAATSQAGATPGVGLAAGAVGAAGYLHLKAFRGPGSTEPFSLLRARATFQSLPQAAPDLPATGQAPDTCTVVAASDRAAWVPEPQLGGGSAPIPAGNEVAIRAGSSRYLTLTKLQDDPAYFSGLSYTFTGLPAGLNVSVPGTDGGFPAFQSAPVPSLPKALTLTSPVDKTNVRLDTTFSWSEPQNGSALVYFWGRGAQNGLFFYCTARDDGRFTFPAATRSALQQLGFSSGRLSEAGRVNALTVRQGGAALSVNLYNLTAFN